MLRISNEKSRNCAKAVEIALASERVTREGEDRVSLSDHSRALLRPSATIIDLMSPETHSQLANFIWSICNLLRGPYKRNEYRKVILPLTVLRRFDCLLAPTKAQVLEEHAKIKAKPETVVRSLLERSPDDRSTTSRSWTSPSCSTTRTSSRPTSTRTSTASRQNVREIMERFAFDQQIARMAEKNLLYEVIKAFRPRSTSRRQRVDNIQMGYVFEELIRIGAEQSNEEAGEHFTPREVIKLMVNLLLSPEQDLRQAATSSRRSTTRPAAPAACSRSRRSTSAT